MRKTVLILTMTFLVATDVMAAPWKIARACRWDWVPPCFTVIGDTVLTCVSSRYFNGPGGVYDTAPKRFWSLEAFTTDFYPAVSFPSIGRTKNWLWVTMDAWRSAYSPEVLATLGWRSDTLPANYFVAYMQLTSGWATHWTRSELWPPMDYLYFRARAGTGTWPNWFHDAGYEDGVSDSWSFRVQGQHYYYNTSTNPPSFVDLGLTRITNACDINHWGFWGENNWSAQ